jgi:phenylpyruvate tautomerase PptA (4-oxalocrotonate tautomerase family)
LRRSPRRWSKGPPKAAADFGLRGAHAVGPDIATPSLLFVAHAHPGPLSKPRGGRRRLVTPPGVLNRAEQKQLLAEATQIIARISGDPGQAARTWVLLTEAAEGGWGIAETAFGKDEFAALAAKKK